MKATLLATLGFFLLVKCHSSPTNLNTKLTQDTSTTVTEDARNSTSLSANKLPQNATANSSSSNNQIWTTDKTNPNNKTTDGAQIAVAAKSNETLASKNAIVINLEEIHQMSVVEYVGRRIKSFWHYLIHGSKEEPQSSFVGRCIGIAKKIRQLMPIAMIGGGIIITKLAFLVIFSLKTIGLVGLLLLLNVASAGAKLGAFLSSKKSDHSPQNLHVHVQPWKDDDHSHYAGPSYGWEDKSDVDIQSHELYNLYEKLKFEHSLRRYLASNSRT